MLREKPLFFTSLNLERLLLPFRQLVALLYIYLSRAICLNNIMCLSTEMKIIGFNVETVGYKDVSFTVWDVGGQDKVLEAINVAKSLCFDQIRKYISSLKPI